MFPFPPPPCAGLLEFFLYACFSYIPYNGEKKILDGHQKAEEIGTIQCRDTRHSPYMADLH